MCSWQPYYHLNGKLSVHLSFVPHTVTAGVALLVVSVLQAEIILKGIEKG